MSTVPEPINSDLLMALLAAMESGQVLDLSVKDAPATTFLAWDAQRQKHTLQAATVPPTTLSR